MKIRVIAGRIHAAVRGQVRLATFLAIVTALAAGHWTDAAAQGDRALAHHATVLNGQTVGSAFQIAEDLALTNAHVVEGLRPGSTVTLVATAKSAQAIAEVVAISPEMDLAVLRAPAGFLPVVSTENAPVAVGLDVLGAGIDASGGRGLGPRMELSGRVVVPAIELGAYGPGLVVRMPGVRPGFSGGPVLDGRGRLVGMITAIRSSGAAREARSSSSIARQGPADEAFVLRAAELRRETERMLRLARR